MSKPAYPSDAAARFLVRMPEGMRDQIAGAAARNGRSMNAEVVARLQASFGHIDAPFTDAQEAVAMQMVRNALSDMEERVNKRMEEIEAEQTAAIADFERRLSKGPPKSA